MNVQENECITYNNAQYNLQGIESLAWKKLVNGSVKKKNGFRTMCVATVDANKTAAIRTVVCRKVDEASKTIFFHTDNRSRKHNDLTTDNRISLLFYDARQRIQIVVKAHASFHNQDVVANERWKATSPQARLGYMTIEPPNTKSDQPTLGYEERFAITKPTAEESNPYEKNFTVVTCVVYELEWLYLDFQGNRKATFYYENNRLVQGHWAVP